MCDCREKHPGIECNHDGCHCHDDEMKIEPRKYYSVSEIQEIDRNARAYGYEVGMGRARVGDGATAQNDNPFLHANWRERARDANLA